MVDRDDRRVDLEEDPGADHRVEGHPVDPGAAHMVMEHTGCWEPVAGEEYHTRLVEALCWRALAAGA